METQITQAKLSSFFAELKNVQRDVGPGSPIWKEFEQIQSWFDDYEQSVLWRCMSSKIDRNLHLELTEIVENHSKLTDMTFYRGLSRRETALIMEHLGNSGYKPFSLDKVVSFSTVKSIAEEFSGKWQYGTNVILKLEGQKKAFNYTEVIEALLHLAPESEFSYQGENKRRANIEMVQAEQEWMLPMGNSFYIVDVNNEQKEYIGNQSVQNTIITVYIDNPVC